MSLFLAVAIACSSVMQPTMAYMVDKDGPVTIVDQSGNSIIDGDDWECSTLKVYRLGGTLGKATIQLDYAPVIAQMDGEQASYANALSKNDLEIHVEDPMPIARYQPTGKDPAPLRPNSLVVVDSGAPPDTQESEADEFGTLTIVDCDGGELKNGANTLLSI